MHLNQYLRHSYRAVADGIGPWEGAALARTIPYLEMDELVRIFLSALPESERRLT